jgi:spore germination protein KA
MNGKKRSLMDNWDEEKLRKVFVDSKDVKIEHFKFDDKIDSELTIVFNDGLTDTARIMDFIMPELLSLYQRTGLTKLHINRVFGPLPFSYIPVTPTEEELSEWIFDGELLLHITQTNAMFKLSVSKGPNRQPEESTTEVTIKGPKDGFVEEISVNISLIRKRMRSHSLCLENLTLGRRTKTKIGLLYVKDILNPSVLSEVRHRLNTIDVDGIYSSEQLEELIVDSKIPLFPLIDFTGRPDKAVYSLIAGRFVILIDGNPMALIGPANFALLLKSPEDIDFNFYYVGFTRIIRGLSLLMTLTLPGLWVALTAFHPDQIPFRLMATIASARIGIPFPAQFEMLLLLFLLEIFREAGIRLPSNIGSTLIVIGGFVIGDASIRSGLVSPSVVVVGAITAVSAGTLVNQSLSVTVSLVRFVLLIFSMVLGIIGLLMGIVLLVVYLSRLRSFGLPYLSPFSPVTFSELLPTIFRFPWYKEKSRPRDLKPIDGDRQQKEDIDEGRI